MPEILAVIAVFFIAVIVYIGMWMQSRDPALYNPREELARMQQQVKWLEERLAKARRENWGQEMVTGIAAERDATAELLARAQAGTGTGAPAAGLAR